MGERKIKRRGVKGEGKVEGGEGVVGERMC